jgi:hypothetical protein
MDGPLALFFKCHQSELISCHIRFTTFSIAFLIESKLSAIRDKGINRRGATNFILSIKKSLFNRMQFEANNLEKYNKYISAGRIKKGIQMLSNQVPETVCRFS